MTNEELQQIQAIIQAAVAPLATKQEIQAIETKVAAVEAQLEQTERTLRSEIQASEKRITKRLDDLEHLAAHYQDKEIRKLSKRVAFIEKQLQIAPAD
jgi:hypothetical protein